MKEVKDELKTHIANLLRAESALYEADFIRTTTMHTSKEPTGWSDFAAGQAQAAANDAYLIVKALVTYLKESLVEEERIEKIKTDKLIVPTVEPKWICPICMIELQDAGAGDRECPSCNRSFNIEDKPNEYRLRCDLLVETCAKEVKP